MPRRPAPEHLCVHCCEAHGESMDHGVPKSWYPNGSARNVEWPTAPSCTACNQRLTRVEQELRRALALQLDPCSPLAEGIPGKVMRSMDVDGACDDRDRRARESRQRDLLDKLTLTTSTRGAFPSAHGPPRVFRPRRRVRPTRRIRHELLAVKLHSDVVRAFGEKLLRVLLWHAYRAYVPVGTVIETHVAKPSAWARVSQIIHHRTSKVYDIPPGVYIVVTKTSDSKPNAIVELRLWGAFCLFVSVLTGADAEPDAPDEP